MKESPRFLKLVMFAMMITIGVVIFPILRIEGTCPMAHLINIVCAVFLGSGYAFTCVSIIGILRMTLMGVPPLTLAGAIFGAALSGISYRLPGGKPISAMIDGIIGTDVIGVPVSYPMMTLLAGKRGIGQTFYTPLFLRGTLVRSSIALIFSSTLAKTGTFTSIQK